MPPLSLQSDDHDAAVDHGRSGNIDSLGFSSNLLETIRDSKSKITAWVDVEKAKADQASAAYRNRFHEEQSAIDAKVAELRTVQLEVGMNKNDDGNNGNGGQKGHGDNLAIRKKALEEQTAKIQLEIMKLQTERNNRERRVEDIMFEESKQRMRAEEARALKKQAEEAKKTTVDDLTKGIVNYKYLGLDFEKTDKENELRFTFSQLDEQDSGRLFSFVLVVDEEENFAILDCRPMIDATTLQEILNQVNQTEDMSYLVRKMRRAFKLLCK